LNIVGRWKPSPARRMWGEPFRCALERAQSALLSNANKQLLMERLLLDMPVVAVT